MELFVATLQHLWILSVDAAPYLLIGFGVATILHAYLPAESLIRLLGRGRFRPTITAAAIGIPLPLCSCSVVPTAVAIREKGASPGATLSFFISTPETGVDSILLTYGMMGPLGPVMAVARPMAAGFSALIAGLSLDLFPSDKSDSMQNPLGPLGSTSKSCCSTSNDEHTCCGESGSDCSATDEKNSPSKAFQKLRTSFLTLFDEIAYLVALGLVVSAVLAALLPEDLGLSGGWSNPLIEMGLAMAIGLPMYVCATASTPLAAVLIAKGLSPGAALVFLLVGPATNIGTIALVKKFLGKRALIAYLTAIVSVSVLFGLGVNRLCQDLTLDFSAISHTHPTLDWLSFSAILLWFLLIWRMVVPFAQNRRQKT